ncbi:hypothetical protein RYA05_01260 [Pseudomonas syringae pv. actinidiae]|nr:hypothetical protein [Pseudomonas syringae pv. actinidiae]
MTVKLKDIRQGQTYYMVKVMAPHNRPLSARVSTVSVAKRPNQVPFEQLNMLIKLCHWHFQTPSIRKHLRELYVSTVNLVSGDVESLCRLFKTRKQAERYAARLISGSMTAPEREIHAKIIARSERYNSLAA